MHLYNSAICKKAGDTWAAVNSCSLGSQLQVEDHKARLPYGRAAETIPVQCMPFGQVKEMLPEGRSILLAKMDCEGCELDVLSEHADWFASPVVKRFVGEMHFHCAELPKIPEAVRGFYCGINGTLRPFINDPLDGCCNQGWVPGLVPTLTFPAASPQGAPLYFEARLTRDLTKIAEEARAACWDWQSSLCHMHSLECQPDQAALAQLQDCTAKVSANLPPLNQKSLSTPHLEITFRKQSTQATLQISGRFT